MENRKLDENSDFWRGYCYYHALHQIKYNSKPKEHNMKTAVPDTTTSQNEEAAASNGKAVATAMQQNLNILLENTVSFQNAISNWNKSNIFNYSLNTVSYNSAEYENVISPFQKSCKNFEVISVSRVQNIYLLSRYLLKKEELTCRYKGDLNEQVLYHGTKNSCLRNILHQNFDWRLHGTNVGHRFGQGVSFSPNARYCIEYCDDFDWGKLIVCNVLMGPVCNGSPETVLPPIYEESKNRAPIYYDTTVKPIKKKDVFVKYSDDEFYPAYVIEFTYNKQYERFDFFE